MNRKIVLTGIIKYQDEFLVVKRSDNEEYFNGAWEFPGGKLEDNEMLFDGLKRELLEETGYGGGQWSEFNITAPNPSNMTNICHTFLAVNVDKISDVHLEKSEHIELCLIEKDILIRILNNCDIIEGVHQASLWKCIYLLND